MDNVGLTQEITLIAFKKWPSYLDFEALDVKTGRACFAADERSTFRADEAPVGVGVSQVFTLGTTLLRNEMLGTDDLRGSQLDCTWETISKS